MDEVEEKHGRFEHLPVLLDRSPDAPPIELPAELVDQLVYIVAMEAVAGHHGEFGQDQFFRRDELHLPAQHRAGPRVPEPRPAHGYLAVAGPEDDIHVRTGIEYLPEPPFIRKFRAQAGPLEKAEYPPHVLRQTEQVQVLDRPVGADICAEGVGASDEHGHPAAREVVYDPVIQLLFRRSRPDDLAHAVRILWIRDLVNISDDFL